eukprot:scaffold305163_cov16-Prasinocladus_malaysianus.AAC.1
MPACQSEVMGTHLSALATMSCGWEDNLILLAMRFHRSAQRQVDCSTLRVEARVWLRGLCIFCHARSYPRRLSMKPLLSQINSRAENGIRFHSKRPELSQVVLALAV